MGNSKIHYAIISVFLILVFIQALYGTYDNSLTVDEACYVGVGKYLINTGDFTYNALNYHPPLSFYINSFFLYFIDIDINLFDPADCAKNKLIFHSGYNPRMMLLLVRLPIIIMSLILAVYVFIWASSLYGKKAGYLALFLYAFSPIIISQAGLATTDFPATFFIFITSYYFWKMLKFKSRKYVFLTAIFFGFAQLTKITSLVLIPIYLIIASVYLYRKRISSRFAIGSFAIIFLITFIIVFLGYGFQFQTLSDSLQDYYSGRFKEEIDKRIHNDILNRLATHIFKEVPLPMSSYVASTINMAYQSTRGVENFIMGKLFIKTPWYFQIVVFLLKTPLSMLLLLFFTIILFKKIKTPKKDSLGHYLIVMVIVGIVVLFLNNRLTSGVRHIAPIYPFLFVFISNIVNLRPKRKNSRVLFKIAMTIILLHYLLTSILVAPHYLAYFNELAGGPKNGYKFLVLSNLDIGQDLPGLKKFMDNNNIKKIQLSYHGSADPADYGINYELMPTPIFDPWHPNYSKYPKEYRYDCRKREGYVAVSVTYLHNLFLPNKSCYDWLQGYEPIAQIGYSINVYNVSKKS